MKTPDELVALIARARASGARELEVRPDGTFRVVLDPPPPEAPRAKSKEQLEAEDDDLLLHSARAR